jgi:hypothetical protein
MIMGLKLGLIFQQAIKQTPMGYPKGDAVQSPGENQVRNSHPGAHL